MAKKKRYFKTEGAAKRAVTMWEKRMKRALEDKWIFHEIVDGAHCWSVWL